MAGQQRIVAPFAGHVIGEGISEDTLERVGTGVRAGEEGEDSLADGQVAEFKFRMVTSQQSLEEELDIGVGVDARYGLFSGGARFDFAESSSLDTKSTYILASATVKNALRSGRDFTPSAAAQALIDAGDVDGFHRAFGTRYVQALRTGGELYVLVRVTSSNMKHQSSVAASLHAELNGLVAGGSFQASFSSARSDASSHTEVSITAMQVGGQGAQLQFVGAEADKIRAQMNAFAAAVHDHPVAYEAELLSYDTLALPFPSPAELADKREVLEDCLRQKQRYWSVLSDLRLAQGPEAGLFFSALPPAEELTDLIVRFTSLLNDLMAHARAVADGTVEPAFFVPVDEPPTPLLRRRSSTRFGQWWSRRSDPTLLSDESLIIHRVGDEVAQHLTVSILDATPDVVERASTFIEKLDLSQGDLGGLSRLPAILDAPLRRLSVNLNQVRSLAGIEQFPSLETLGCQRNRVEDLGPVAALGGLTSLFVVDNEIGDLAPIAGLTRLEDLHLGGNEVESLEALRGFPRLRNLALANGDPEQLADGVVVRPFRFLDNPIDDARALDDLPLLRNVLTAADRLDVTAVTYPDLAPRTSGTAVRQGNSNRFALTPADGGPPATWIIATLTHERGAGADAVMVSAYLPSLKTVAIAFADPEDRTATLSLADTKARIDAEPMIGFAIALLVGVEPTLIFEARAAD